MALDPLLNVLLVVTGSLQVGALATRIAGRKRVALAMAGTNAALALALTLQDFVVSTYNRSVNHASHVAQHFMILKALENGVGEECLGTSSHSLFAVVISGECWRIQE